MSKKSKPPLSEARLAANRANAQKSSGPKTPAGKLRSAANACQHGFAGTNFAVVRLEDPAEIDKLKADLMATYQPVNNQEMWVIERIALAQNSIFRSYRLESGLFTSCLNESLDPRSDKVLITMTADMIGGNGNPEAVAITRAQNRNYGLGAGFHSFIRKTNSWPLFLRYQAQAERNYRRGIEDLEPDDCRWRARSPGVLRPPASKAPCCHPPRRCPRERIIPGPKIPCEYRMSA
jgi:hypothetical protein